MHRLTSDEVSSPHWPHSYAVELRSRFGATLEVSLTTTNTGDAGFDIEEALHTYLAVGDVREVAVEGLDGVRLLRQGDGRRAGAPRASSSSAGRPTRSFGPAAR